MEQLYPWFLLKRSPGVGNLICKRLINRFGSPQAVMQADPNDLLKVEGLSRRLIKAIKEQKLSDDIKSELDRVANQGYQIVTLTDKNYPALLREIPDPPLYLYVYGDLSYSSKNISMVGSRHATPYGLDTTKRLSHDLCTHGLTVVSGMARGIDTAAHQGALNAGGNTIAVLGSGLNIIYPRENSALFHQIAKSGAVVSEFSLDAEPEAYNFPLRNRIISGMSLGTVIVEATLRSGSLITARLAAEQNREVFAVPGSINSFKSTGTHTLIKQGAKLVEKSTDVLEEITGILGYPEQNNVKVSFNKTESIEDLTTIERSVLKALDHYALHIDDLIRKLDISSSELSGALLNLELKDLIHQAPGNMFYLKKETS